MGSIELRRDLLLAAVVFSSRLPFLSMGYGAEPDSWRVVEAGRASWAEGRYVPSRFGNNPLHDGVMGLFEWGGPWLSNGSSAAVSAVAAMGLAAWLRARKSPSPQAWALAWALIPGVYGASTVSKDYVWGLCALAASLWAVQTGRPLAGGLSAAVMTGTRLSLGPLALPLSLAPPCASPGGRRRFLFFSGAFWLGVLAIFGWVHAELGWSFLRFDDIYPVAWTKLLHRGLVDPWGLLGFLSALALSLWAILRTFGTTRRLREAEVWDRMWLAALAAFPVVIFLRVPAHGAYLLPATLPWIAGCAGHLPARAGPMAVALFAGSSLLGGFVLVDAPFAPPPGPASFELQLGGKRGRVEPLRGPMLLDRARRSTELRQLDRWAECASQQGPDTYILAGPWASKLHRRWRDTRGDDSPFRLKAPDPREGRTLKRVPGVFALSATARAGRAVPAQNAPPLACP